MPGNQPRFPWRNSDRHAAGGSHNHYIQRGECRLGGSSVAKPCATQRSAAPSGSHCCPRIPTSPPCRLLARPQPPFHYKRRDTPSPPAPCQWQRHRDSHTCRVLVCDGASRAHIAMNVPPEQLSVRYRCGWQGNSQLTGNDRYDLTTAGWGDVAEGCQREFPTELRCVCTHLDDELSRFGIFF
jgi:hypothetical protein